jgi:aminopeptidase N
MTSIDDGQIFGKMGGTVYAEDATSPFDDYVAVYDKGGWTLHMLRHILTDAKFFAALKDYAQAYAYGNAETQDFQRVCEAYYGNSLDWFFQQWIYAPGRPFYKVSKEIGNRNAQGNYDVTVSIKQKQSHEIPGREVSVYLMPLDVMIYYADGSKETQVIFNNKRKQTFTLTTTRQPVRVAIDEDNWVLKKMKG